MLDLLNFPYSCDKPRYGRNSFLKKYLLDWRNDIQLSFKSGSIERQG
jgi:hypothetical protein